MGPIGNPTAVVDPELRVYGVSNLQVVDCSMMPNVPSGNTNDAPAVKIRSFTRLLTLYSRFNFNEFEFHRRLW
jgi:hypothetical protein